MSSGKKDSLEIQMTQRNLVTRGGPTNTSVNPSRRGTNASMLGNSFIKPDILDYKYEKVKETETVKKPSFQNLYQSPTQYINALS